MVNLNTMKFWVYMFFIMLVRIASLHICGNYCGPDWCNGRSLPEKDCDGSFPADPRYPLVDNCCREHDMCCGWNKDRSQCNDNLVHCISKRGATLAKLRGDFRLVCGDSGILVMDFFRAMDFLESFLRNATMCCSTKC
jgi:hypothetical protein